MKILVDTNILISALLYPNSVPSQALLRIAGSHELILSDYNIAELRRVARDKFEKKQPDIDVLLASLPYTLISAPLSPQKLISDPKDAPILNAAIIEDVDIIISGDKHFRALELERPKVLTAAQFMELTN
ncbi:MAG: putative toxin-antitoxin system toxin component, PIN family [Oscillospiraceae bacterium]|jgi:putative PIN family toxin of toxin-antitoxin system|nr:putative toxin-antitoxin system toxin component, PIN family [Oscillospiraceae bacterium]